MQWFQKKSRLNGFEIQGRHKFSNDHNDLILLQIYFTLISLTTKVPVILHIKFQPYILSHSGEKVDFNDFTIFSIGGHLGFSTMLTFSGLKSCSLIMLHVKFEIHGCSGFREKVV